MVLNGRMRITAAILAGSIALNVEAVASPLATPWVEAHGAKVRLVAGSVASKDAEGPTVVAGLAIHLNPGWKTYWRSPGDAGGLPPHFNWSASVNLSEANVLYPAPRRFKDSVGDSVGYSGAVVFPIEVRPQDPDKPVELRLTLSYGICRDICVPAEAQLALTLPANATVPASPEIANALAAVPRGPDERQPDDPELVSSKAHLDGDRPKLMLEARFPGSAASGDMFVEAMDGAYVPLPTRVAEKGDTISFEVDLSEAAPEELRGKTLRITMVSDAGQSEAYWTID